MYLYLIFVKKTFKVGVAIVNEILKKVKLSILSDSNGVIL